MPDYEQPVGDEQTGDPDEHEIDARMAEQKLLNDLCNAARDAYQIVLETELKQRHDNVTRRSLQSARKLLLDALRAAGREDLIR